ncbi:chemotaxis protein [Parasedimentitalea maritima]|uniref:Chemotaxis protein n=1 Tax=Parasedimentitalea maritima TaxID=2578117 RepID=A0A6A4RC31_9RHOB|nr:chemotaxis protein [Zongyanglinia marina]KAE9627844.1 chemotaxis protein [Zongyanglinia marina]
MSFVDRKIEVRPSRGDAPFKLEEVFFSRTDERGVIESGNSVFSRVAHYDWDELHGAPHKLIRHPDMPKGVFWLLWDRLKRGESIGAYVKNQAKDGLSYWVFAVVTPCEGGYLSARIKPTSELFATVEAEYAKLLTAEAEEGLSPEDSATRLLERLTELGFDEYEKLSTHALSQELVARDAGLGNPPNLKIKKFHSMLESAEELTQETESLVQEFEAMRTIPHNLRVIASRIEPAGGPVTVLSQNYGTMSRDMSEWFEKHVLGENSNFSAIKSTVNLSMFAECLVSILRDCDKQLSTEQNDHGHIDLEKEHKLLASLIARQADKAETGLRDVSIEADRILNACTVMHRHFLGLSSTRVLCKIESARLSRDGETLTTIIDQLGVFQARISAQLDRIGQLSTAIRASEND